MKKYLFLIALLMIACQEDNSRSQPPPPPPPKNIVFEESINAGHFDISVYLDKKRNVTCWLALSNVRTDTGAAMWCMKNDPEAPKDK